MNRLMTPREQLVVGFVGVAVVMGSLTAIWLARGPAEAETPEEPLPVAAPVENESPTPPSVEPAPVAAPVAVVEPPVQQSLIVSVQGAVNRPGVYTVRANERVYDLIDRAGGLLESAETKDINLAAKLIDGTTLTIPERHGTITEDGTVELRRKKIADATNPPQYTLSGWPQEEQGPLVSAPEADMPVSAPSSGQQPTDVSGKLDLNRATYEQLQDLPGIGPVLAQSIVDYRTNSPFSSVDQLQNVRGIGPKRFESLRDLVVVNP